MDGMTYLTVAYLGMIAGIAIWTWTVVNRSRTIEQDLRPSNPVWVLSLLKRIQSAKNTKIERTKGHRSRREPRASA